MRKNLLLAGLLTTFCLVVKGQVGINTTNPQGVFNIDGLKNNPTTGVPTAVQAKDDLVTTSNGNLGLGLTAPGTTLDVNGAITNRETALAVTANAVTIPVNVSQVQLTGAATANVAITAFAAPNPGQRLIVYNNTTGGFGATLDGVTIPNGKALEFVFSNSFWRSTDGGAAGASSVNIYNANGTLTGNRTVTQGANTLAFTGTQTNAFSVDGNTLSVDAANGRVGVGITTPTNKLHVEGSQLLNAAATVSQTKNALDINIGQDGFSYGNRADNFGVNMKTSSSVFTGSISRINFGDISTTTATGTRYLSFSVGLTPNELMYLTDGNSGRVGIQTVNPTEKLDVGSGNVRIRAITTNTGVATDKVVVADGNGVLKTLSNPINTIFSMSTSSTYNLPSNALFNAGTPQVLPFTNADVQISQGTSAVWDATNNRYIINESGLYEIDALSFFGTTGSLSGSASWIGVNLGVTKNGTAAADLIATGRSNIPQAIANVGNTPIAFHCIVSLSAGDHIYLTMFRGASDTVSGGNVQSTPPNGLTECRHFSLKKL